VTKERVMSEFTLDDLAATVAKCLGAGAGEPVGPDTVDTPFADLGYDSLAVYELMTRLQDDTGVSISDEDIETIETPRQAVEFIAAHLASRVG
jgi:act minimal PKS acyl carrier protein